MQDCTHNISNERLEEAIANQYIVLVSFHPSTSFNNPHEKTYVRNRRVSCFHGHEFAEVSSIKITKDYTVNGEYSTVIFTYIDGSTLMTGIDDCDELEFYRIKYEKLM